MSEKSPEWFEDMDKIEQDADRVMRAADKIGPEKTAILHEDLERLRSLNPTAEELKRTWVMISSYRLSHSEEDQKELLEYLQNEPQKGEMTAEEKEEWQKSYQLFLKVIEKA